MLTNSSVTRRLAAVCLILGAAAAGIVSPAAAQDVVSGKGSAVSETGLGNLVADAVKRLSGADIAFVQASLLRESSIPLTELSAATVRQALVDPDQPIVTLSLTGNQIREALERSLSLVPKSNAGFLQISGINFRYTQGSQAGKRVGDILLGRKPLQPAETHTVAMPRSLASGALGYFRIWGDAQPRGASPGTIGQSVDRLFESRVDPAVYTPDGRIKRL